MKTLRRSMLVFTAVVCFAVPAVFAGAGLESCDFLTIGIGARALGMGGAFSGLADDASAGYWNPGGLVQISNTEVLTMYNAWIGGISQAYMGFGRRLANGSNLGFQVNYVASGDIEGTGASGEAIGNFSADWMSVGVTYAGYIGEAASVGINLKNVTEKIVNDSASGLAADVGMLYRAGGNTKLGLVLQNAGSGIRYEQDESASPFPVVIRAGVSREMLDGQRNGIILVADVSKESSAGGIGIGMGGEYRAGRIALRAGAEQSDGVVSPSLGVGIDAGSFLVDVGGGMNQNLGSAYKISLTGRF